MPTDTDRLVVRRAGPRRSAWLWLAGLVVALAALWGAFEAGRSAAGYSMRRALIEQRAGAAEAQRLTTRVHELESQVAALELARRVDRTAYQQVDKSLAELQARIGEQSQELAFYRGIVSPVDGLVGLRVQRLRVLPGVEPRRYRVRIVLIQAARQDAIVSGSVDLGIDGLRAGRAASLPLAEIGTASKTLAFSFRYFAEVETEISLPADFQPQRVQIEVRPAHSATPLRETYPWKIETT
jgi:hypothetical protein